MPVTFIPNTGNWLLQADLPGLPQGAYIATIHDVTETGGGQSMAASPVSFTIFVGLSNGGHENTPAYGLVPIAPPAIPIAPGDALVIDAVDYGDGQSGASAGLGPNPFVDGGLAAFISHAYARPGTYTVGVRGHDVATGASFGGSAGMVILDCPLTSAANDITTDYNTAWTGTLATFNDSDPGATPANHHYAVSVDWGDGSVGGYNPGDPAASGSGIGLNGWSITGSHTYASAGHYHTLVTITDLVGGAPTTTSGNVTVGPFLTVTPTTAYEGDPDGDFHYALESAKGGAYATTVDTPVEYGIGGNAAPGVTYRALGNVDIALGTSSFDQSVHVLDDSLPGLKVIVTPVSTTQYIATGPATTLIADAPLAVAASDVKVVTGATFTMQATVSDGNHGVSAAADLTVTFTWDDGTDNTTALLVAVPGSPGQFTATASHSYAKADLYAINIGAKDAGESYARTTAYATVAGIKLEIDSDNNDGTSLPGNTAAEIALHNVAPGKVIAEGGRYTDPLSPFTPFVVDLPADTTGTAKWRLRITSNSSDITIYNDPDGTSLTPMQADPLHDGQLIGSLAMLVSSSVTTTFYIDAATITDAAVEVTLAAEIVAPSSTGSAANAVACSDNALVCVVNLLDVQTMNEGETTGSFALDQKFYPGAYVPLDNNDWDYDQVTDLQQPSPAAAINISCPSSYLQYPALRRMTPTIFTRIMEFAFGVLPRPQPYGQHQ